MSEVSKTSFTLCVIRSQSHRNLFLNRRCFDVESSLHCSGRIPYAWTLPSFPYSVVSFFVDRLAVIHNALYRLPDSLAVNLCLPTATSSFRSSFLFFSLLLFQQSRGFSWVVHFLIRNHISHICDASLDLALTAVFEYCYKPCILP